MRLAGGNSFGSAAAATDISPLYERNQEATLYVGNLDTRVDEDILWELFVQCGPIKNVHVPRDKITGMHQGYGFVEFHYELDAEYAIKVMTQVKLFQKLIRINKAAQDKRQFEVGANLFVGNLDPDVDEKKLYDTFSSFGAILTTKIMRDPETGESRGFGFISYDSFEASDLALFQMNGQFLCNRPVHVSYAFKKDTKGERHGSAAERLIAANRPPDLSGGPGGGGGGTSGGGMLPPTPLVPNINTAATAVPPVAVATATLLNPATTGTAMTTATVASSMSASAAAVFPPPPPRGQ